MRYTIEDYRRAAEYWGDVALEAVSRQWPDLAADYARLAARFAGLALRPTWETEYLRNLPQY